MDAFKALRGTDALAGLPARARDLVERCPETWQPGWLEARALLELERPAEARAGFERARDIATLADDPVGVARAADQLGWIAYGGGALTEGRAHYDTAIAAAARAGRSDLEGFARNNLAGLLMDSGDFAGAGDQLVLAEQALVRAGRADAALGLAYNRATLLLELGDAVAARATLERVHGEAGAAGDAWTVDASAVVLGNLHLALRQPAQARVWHETVTNAFDDLYLLARLGLGRAALDEGRNEDALLLLQAAAEGATRQERLFAGMTEVFLTEAELRVGRTDAAEGRLSRWIKPPDATDVPAEIAAGARWMLGRVRLEQGRPDEALALLTAAVDMLEAQGAALDPLYEGLRFLRQRRDPYVDMAVALATARDVGADREARVLRVISRAKARGLQRALHEAAGQEGADLDRVQRGLIEGELLLDYLIGDERGIVLAVTPSVRRAVPIAGRRQLGSSLADFRGSLTGAGPDSGGAGRRVRDALLEPVQALLSPVRRLYVVPDGELALIPFEALPGEGGGYLGDHLEIALLPLAGVPERRATERAPLLLAGQPVFGAGAAFAELPWSAFELSRLRERWGPGRTTLLSGAELTPAGLAALDLSSFRTLHLATHAVASTVDPRRCGVVLSGGELLGLDSILKLDLDRTLVVLSACRTGEGELIPGEGIVGLGWAFLRAGASAVVTSLWGVDDAVSARLMVAFHRRLEEGADPVAALAGARREIAEKEGDPTLWAPFVIVLRPEIR